MIEEMSSGKVSREKWNDWRLKVKEGERLQFRPNIYLLAILVGMVALLYWAAIFQRAENGS
ncbi:MAG: hypothetical protein Tsb002_11660 [Wenzhouxiangellaceae bacterium]